MTRSSCPMPARRPRRVLARIVRRAGPGLAAGALAVGLGACGAVDNAGATTGAVVVSQTTASTVTTTAGAASAPGQTTSERLAAVRARLDETLSKATACDADAQCRSVAVGAKSCGGPTDYRAFSIQGIAPRTVEDLASQERDLSLAEVRESGRASPCFAVPDPGARCAQRKCEPGPGLEPPPAPSDTGSTKR